MLNAIHRVGRLFMSKGWIVGLLLIALTVSFGTYGFLGTTWYDGRPLSLADALYKAVSLLAIQTGDVPTAGVWPLELARWLGMVFWASAVLTVVIRLFREPVHRLLVKAFATDHVIIAGLGQHGGRLVDALRAKGQTVVVIEPNRSHPAVDRCRGMGAIVLFGEPDDERTLLAANLPSASTALALFLDERDCVRVAMSAHRVLHARNAKRKKPSVRVVLRLTEPGVLDVVRRHKIKTDPNDRVQLEILNSHEIAATTMVREATANSPGGKVQKAMVLGLGSHHRLGEMVVLRAAKDHLIANDGRPGEKLLIHVFDKQGTEWLESFRSRYPFVEQVCTVTPHPCWARKVGASGSGFEHDYDAAFVCIPDEGHATAQAAMLRREVLTGGQPIMVRVLHSHSGYGELIGDPASGWGDNIHAVGLEDSLVDPDTATRPEIEMRAHTIHHDYRRVKRREYLATKSPEERQKIEKLSANCPWRRLNQNDREQNRRLAELYDEYLGLVLAKKQTRYKRAFAPIHFGRVATASPFELPSVEMDALAEVEHSRWLRAKRAQGWTYDAVRNDQLLKSPYIREYSELTEEQKLYASEFVRGISRVLALADYTIVAYEPNV